MNPAQLTDLVHMTPEREFVYSGSLSKEQMDWIDEHRDIIEQRLTGRKNASGFYVTFPPALAELLGKTKTLSIDLETSALTRFALPTKMDNKSQVGGKPFSHYRARYPECTLNTRPRIRVIAVHTVDGPCPGECFAFDLDAMPSLDLQKLIDTIMDGHILVGHNIFGSTLPGSFRKRKTGLSLFWIRCCSPAYASRKCCCISTTTQPLPTPNVLNLRRKR